MERGKCSICDAEKELPHETPDDPPMFKGGRHCQSCEDWLLLGTNPEDG